jgi:hypothetical protein
VKEKPQSSSHSAKANSSWSGESLRISGSNGPNDLKKLRPDVKLVVIDNATHVGDRGADRHPEFIKTIREFINSNRTASLR